MNYFVYVLENSSGIFYIGSTNDLKRRLAEHNDTARASWASRRGPWHIVAHEEFSSRAEAMQRERYLKKMKKRGTVAGAGWRKSTSGGS